MPSAAEYFEAIHKAAKNALPSWQWRRIHAAALPSSGGRALANRRAETAKDQPDATDVHVPGVGGYGPVKAPPPGDNKKKRRLAKSAGGGSNGVMVAFFLDEATATALSALGAAVDPEDMHLTLAYLGEVGEMGPEVAARLIACVYDWNLAQDPAPLEATISGIGRFHAPDPTLEDAQDVIYASVGCPDLPAMRQELVQLLEANDLEYSNDFGFTPHITLSYVDPVLPAAIARLEAPLTLSFQSVTVCIGDERLSMPFGGGEFEDFDDDDATEDYRDPAGPADMDEVEQREPIHLAVEAWVAKADAPGQDEARLVYGAALIPGLPDSQGDVLTADDIEKAAHDFMLDYQQSGVQHKGDAKPDLRIVESWIAPADMKIAGRPVLKGTWLLTVYVENDSVWAGVKSGALTGFSIQGSAVRQPLAA